MTKIETRKERDMTQFRITPLNRPVDNYAWTYTPTPEQQAASEAWQKQHAALYQQFEAEWVPPPGYSAERDNEEMECIESAAFSTWMERRKGRTAAASTPVWMDAFDYWLTEGPNMDDNGLLAKEPTAVSLTLPFVLKGGGDMQITFETKKYVNADLSPKTCTRIEGKHRLVARTEHGVFVGHLEREYGERSWYVVSLPSKAPQAVADWIAKTLDAMTTILP